MKKSQLRRLIRETIKEQYPATGGLGLGGSLLANWTSACTPGPNCVEPTVQNTTSFGTPHLFLACPQGFQFENPNSPPSYSESSNYRHLIPISYCVPAVSGAGGDVCEDFNQLGPEQQQQLCLAYGNLTTSNPSLEAIGENCCGAEWQPNACEEFFQLPLAQQQQTCQESDPSTPIGFALQNMCCSNMSVNPPVTGSMASMPQLKPQNRQR